jgi:NAD(P)H dehydrogenase (quinone)
VQRWRSDEGPLPQIFSPAIMKGYIDRVFAHGGLLSGRQSVLVTISGAPLPLLVKIGDWDAREHFQ